MASTDELLLRPAEERDADAVARVFLTARAAAVPAMPPIVHEDHDVAAHLVRRVAAGRVWVAEQHDRVRGFLDLEGAWLNSLYVHPGHTRKGIGSALLELAKSLRPDGFGLWVFESNAGARRFYLRHGLVELERTDGSGNEEQAPDVRMVWPGRHPLSHLRAEIDRVDDDLAVLLARRAALTAAIQRFKDVPGHAGRDPRREADIAERMARHAPGLGAEAFRRIIHEVITVSLDAAERTGPARPGRRPR